MAKTFRPMPAVNGVANGSTATLNCPIGLTYHGLLFTMGGTFDIEDLSEIRVKGNGRAIYTVNGADLDKMNIYEGRASALASTQFYLDFERYGLEIFGGSNAIDALGGRELTAIGTGIAPTDKNPIELQTLQIELDITGATNPTLSAKALQSPPRSLGFLKKRRKFVYAPAGAIEFEIADLPRGDLIDKIYIKSAGNRITQVKLERDNFLAFDRTPNENNLMQIDGVRVPQASWFVLDPSEAGRGDEAIITAGVNDLRLKVTVSAADTLTVYVDYLGGLTGN